MRERLQFFNCAFLSARVSSPISVVDLDVGFRFLFLLRSGHCSHEDEDADDGHAMSDARGEDQAHIRNFFRKFEGCEIRPARRRHRRRPQAG